MNKKKKLLTFDDLYNFYLNQHKSCSFSSKETGYQISVQIPASFEISEDYKDDTLLFCVVKLMHSGENRNHSSVTDEALRKAAKTLAYKPILANFMEYTDENGETLKDFTAHDMEFNDDGVTYIERQVGCFTAHEPYFKVEEETGHNFLYGICAIPYEYSDATSIIKRKNGTKVSVELIINEMTYNNTTRILELTDVTIQGATCLGRDPETLEEIGEGMQNARLDILDFSAENNSVFANYNNQMIDFQARLEKLENAYFNKDFLQSQDNTEEGGNTEDMNKFNELLEKYGKTVEDITFEYENMTDEALESKFEELFGEKPVEPESANDPHENESENDPSNSGNLEEGEESVDVKELEGCKKKKQCEEEDPETETVTETLTEVEGCKKRKQCEEDDPASSMYTKTFQLSHDDIKTALYSLLAPYEEANNDYYWIADVYDTYFVYQGCTGEYYGQKYTKDNDVVAFSGERYGLYVEYLTESEKNVLNEMRSNYSSIIEQLNSYKYAEDIADKLTVFEDESYSAYLETEAFKELMKEETLSKYSKEQIIEKADAALGKAVKESKSFAFNFSKENAKKKRTKIGVFSDFENAEDQNPYGDYFKSMNN